MHRLMESISFCPLFGKPCAERHPLDQSVKAEMALDERRSAAAVARHEQERRQSTSIPMPSSSSSSLTSSSTSSHQLHHHHNQEQGQEQNLPLHSPPCHPVVHHHHRDRAAEEQLQCYPLSSPRRQFHLIVSSSFKSHLDSMSACGQRTCSPVIKNFSSTCSDPTETTARLLISSEWDDLAGPLSCFYDSKTDQVIPISRKKMPVTNGCKSSAILNGHHKVVTTANLSSKVAPAAKPVTPAADINKTTATTTAPSEAPSFRVLTWNSDWIQCSGHEGVFAPSKEGTIWKKTSCNPSSKTKSPTTSTPLNTNNCKPLNNPAKNHSSTTGGGGGDKSAGEVNNEIEAYKKLMGEPEMREFVPRFYSEILMQGDHFIEIEDLLRHFRPSDSSLSLASAPSFLSSSSSSTPVACESSTTKTTTAPSIITSSAQTSPPSSMTGTSGSDVNTNGSGGRKSGIRENGLHHRNQHHNNRIHIMDIKMGTRTFLEQEASCPTERADLYDKMIKVDPLEPTAEEHANKSVTKLRYMSFREGLSSSSQQGFRIEGVQPFPTKDQIGKDFQRIKDEEDIRKVLQFFLNGDGDSSSDIYSSESDPGLRNQKRASLKQQLVARLHQLRKAFMNSKFFSEHEVIGSSLLVIHDTEKLGVWMIDFAKSVPLPPGTSVDHVSPWRLGNHEDGYLFGLHNLIRLLETL